MSTQPQDANPLEAFTSSLREHWKLFLAEGVLLLILGLLAVALPMLATIGFTIVLGWLFLISGIMGLITTFYMRGAPGFWWALISALIGIGAGVVLLISPVSGAVSLTLVLIAFFIVEGVATIMYAVEHRAQLTDRWGWMLFSGVIDLILAAMILAGLPSSAAWAIGLLVGINMIFGGGAMIGMALAAKNSKSAS
ncbi:MAG: HdeD family acid-resistance protein [Pseudomonadota bacterium]